MPIIRYNKDLEVDVKDRNKDRDLTVTQLIEYLEQLPDKSKKIRLVYDGFPVGIHIYQKDENSNVTQARYIDDGDYYIPCPADYRTIYDEENDDWYDCLYEN